MIVRRINRSGLVEASGTSSPHPVLVLTGEHDLSTRHRVRAVCRSLPLDLGTDRLTVDLTDVSFADCGCFDELVRLAVRAHELGIVVETRVPRDGWLVRLFTLLGIGQLMGVTEHEFDGSMHGTRAAG